jgi:MtrB/PioB family decaheme-associated outer membrane protein
MKSRMILLIIGMILLPAFPALSAESTFEGEVGGTGMLTHVSGNNAKFNEYRDIRDGVYSGISLKYDSDTFFAKGKAADIGYDTQRYRFDGGVYGNFKTYFEYSEIPHNFTYDARTFYNGAGTNILNYSVAPTADTSSWKSFNYDTRRRTYGGGVSLDLLKPFFFDLSVSNEKKTGTYPTGAAGTSPGGISLELPQPIDYTTNTLNVQAGYAKNPFFAAVSFMYQDFDNADKTLFFQNPAGPASNRDALNLPPSNQYYKLAFKGSVQLPLNSKFSMNLATSRTTSETDLLTSYITATANPITLSNSVFHGKIDTQNYNFVLTSNPVTFLTGKIYYKYYDRKNKSDQITTIDPAFAGGAPFTNPLFDYHKNNFGIDLGWKLPARFQLDTAYQYLKTDRARGDLPKTVDNIYSVGLKWRGLDFITPKVGYEHLQRTADIGVLLKEYAGDQTTENAIAPYVRRFDAAPLNRETFKAAVDIYPLDNLSFNIGYKYKYSDYKDTILGLKNVTSNEVNLDAGYSIGKIAQLNAYFSMELDKNYQFQRAYTSGNANPSVQNSTNYNWDAKIRDNSYAWGVNTEVYIIPKQLTLILSYDQVSSNGQVDLTYLNAAGLAAGTPAGTRTNDNIDIGNWDDYRLNIYQAKLRYSPSKSYTITAGYAYEQYKYNDAQLDNYTLVPATTGTNGAFLTGAYANPNYRAHLVFFVVNYRF